MLRAPTSAEGLLVAACTENMRTTHGLKSQPRRQQSSAGEASPLTACGKAVVLQSNAQLMKDRYCQHGISPGPLPIL